MTLAFAQLLFAFVGELSPRLFTIIVVLGLTGWERYARVMRAEVLAPFEKDFLEAARAMGASSATHDPAAFAAQHLLSFLGVSTDNSYPTWRQMIALGRDLVRVA